MDSPNKRIKLSPPPQHGLATNEDFVPFGDDDDEQNDNTTVDVAKFGFGRETRQDNEASQVAGRNQHARRAQYKDFRGQPWYDRKHAQDRPKSQHVLPGHEPWLLVKTKLGRRFVYNTQTRESFWRIPSDVFAAVKELEREEARKAEQAENARWAEEELRKMRGEKAKMDAGTKGNDAAGRGELERTRRRRSESLQREDEEAMMAELAAEAERQDDGRDGPVAESQPVQQRAGEVGYDSEGSYEYVEVTDSEGEDDPVGNGNAARTAQNTDGQAEGELEQEINEEEEAEEAPLEFGEDDIAYQLAAMGADYGLDPGEFGEEADDEDMDGDDDGTHGLPISSAEATNLFREMLDDHQISPYTPWETLLEDADPATSIVHDSRYLILSSTRTRHECWQAWAKDTAARLRAERAKQEKRDPKVQYLKLVAELAGPKCKLYWAEFKRKFKRELASGVDRNLGEKHREKLFRDYVARWKLSESVRKADLVVLLEEGVRKGVVEKDMGGEELAGVLGGDVRWVSLPAGIREEVVTGLLRRLDDELAAVTKDGEQGKMTEKERKREEALAERRRQVDEERRKAEKEERFARRDLRVEEDELRRAMDVGPRGLNQLLK